MIKQKKYKESKIEEIKEKDKDMNKNGNYHLRIVLGLGLGAFLGYSLTNNSLGTVVGAILGGYMAMKM